MSIIQGEMYRNQDVKKQRSRKTRIIPHKPKLLDPRCQEATPEILRIEIDQIFKEFLDNPDQLEHIFPSDLNNLQRKYIHDKAQKMNIISKSYGKEPNRRLHIKKRQRQLDSQSFMIRPGESSLNYMDFYLSKAKVTPLYIPPARRMQRNEKVFGRLVNGVPTIPSESNLSDEVAAIRRNLPVFNYKDVIMETIRNNQIVIIASETGSGKTTQVSQYIMDDMRRLNRPCKIICTQPRRISTVSAAERVAYERGDTLGASVGYQIRLEQKYGVSTNLVYCTIGVFLRNLMIGCDALRNITHIIIDEIHERDKLSDFLLTCLKQTLPHFPELKVILMSATINTSKFIEYFGRGEVLSIPGRLFTIDTFFLEEILYKTQYMSAKMFEMKKKERTLKAVGYVVEDVPISVYHEGNVELDEALDEYMDFSDNYDYKVHYEEATLQLGMYFLSEGFSVDYQHSRTGRTALMIAAWLGDKEFISRLCSMGADMALRCNMGKTAFDYAYDKPDTLQLLEYIRSKKVDNTLSSSTSEREAEYLLHLYDKTTSDDYIDFDLVVTVISFICTSDEPGSILVFLPGYDDIMMCNDKITNSCMLPPGSYRTFFLHSSMNIRDQHEVFRPLYKQRKIILSTNIAETSITIDDVVYVIDTGKAKEKCFDSYNKVSSLQTRWISQACAKQRTGRAGRTRPGQCFRLYSHQRYENMPEERVPEILRVSLEELCLHTKVIAPEGMNIHEFLSRAPDAPSANSIKVAIENLQFLGALDKEEDLTPLGEYLAQLSIEPQLGKMLIYGVIFKCLEPVLTLAAAMSHKDPFMLPPQANLRNVAAERRKELLGDVMSDHLLYLAIFKRWQEETHNKTVDYFCLQYFLSNPTMCSILETRSQLLGQLRAAGFVHQANSIQDYNKNAQSWPLVKAVVCTGLYPNLAYPLRDHLVTRSEKNVNVQNNSACAKRFISSWLMFDEKIKQRNCLVIRGVTAVTTITVSLMCGIDTIETAPNSILIDDWLEFEFPNNQPILLRASIDNLIKRVLANPSYRYSESENNLIRSIRSILDVEEAHAELQVPMNIGERPKFFFPHASRRVRHRPNPLRGGFVRSVDNARNARPVPALTVPLQNLSVAELAPNRQLSASPPVLNRVESLENKFGDYTDMKIFVLIRPKQKKSVAIAQTTNKWVFAPQTEKKILHYKTKGKSVYLVFTVNQSRAFQGIAEFVSFYNEPNGKPTCHINWMYKLELEYCKVRQLRNPYNENRPIYEGLDGQVIQQTVAEELVRIYNEVKYASETQGFASPTQGCSTNSK